MILFIWSYLLHFNGIFDKISCDVFKNEIYLLLYYNGYEGIKQKWIGCDIKMRSFKNISQLQ